MHAVIARVLGEGFRVFFLSAGIYGLFVGLVWGLWLTAPQLDQSFAMAPPMWHAHEMIFGYATAALGGFFLTAVPNWTGTPEARTAFISTAAGLWVGRAAGNVVFRCAHPLARRGIGFGIRSHSGRQDRIAAVAQTETAKHGVSCAAVEHLGRKSDDAPAVGRPDFGYIVRRIAGRIAELMLDDRNSGRTDYTCLYPKRNETRG